MEKECRIQRLEGELSMLEQTLRKQKREEESKREELTQKEKTLAQMEGEVMKKMETQGGILLRFK